MFLFFSRVNVFLSKCSEGQLNNNRQYTSIHHLDRVEISNRQLAAFRVFVIVVVITLIFLISAILSQSGKCCPATSTTVSGQDVCIKNEVR